MKIRKEIKEIILDYCEGRNHLEFNREDLNDMVERIEEAVIDSLKNKVSDIIEDMMDRIEEEI